MRSNLDLAIIASTLAPCPSVLDDIDGFGIIDIAVPAPHVFLQLIAQAYPHSCRLACLFKYGRYFRVVLVLLKLHIGDFQSALTHLERFLASLEEVPPHSYLFLDLEAIGVTMELQF